MSWVSNGLKFIRVRGRISPVASKKLDAGSVFFCEIPAVGYYDQNDQNDKNDKNDKNDELVSLNHGVFAMACAQKWSSMKGISFPCTFNRIVNLKHVELLDFLFKEDQVLAKTLATSLKTECTPPFMFTGLQIFDRDEKVYNSSAVQISEGRTFLVAMKDIPVGEVIVYTDNSEFNYRVKKEILLNTSMNPVRSVFELEDDSNEIIKNTKCEKEIVVENVLREALRQLEKMMILPTPSQEEINVILKRVEKFVAIKDMGFSNFKKEAETLIESAKNIESKDTDFDKMEKEYERLVKESGINEE